MGGEPFRTSGAGDSLLICGGAHGKRDAAGQVHGRGLVLGRPSLVSHRSSTSRIPLADQKLAVAFGPLYLYGTMKEGTITVWCEHEHKDWLRNQDKYTFPQQAVPGGGTLQVVKHGDGTIETALSQVAATNITFRVKQSLVPPSDRQRPHDLFVAVTWTPSEVKLYLNGNHVETRLLS